MICVFSIRRSYILREGNDGNKIEAYQITNYYLNADLIYTLMYSDLKIVWQKNLIKDIMLIIGYVR